MTRFDFDSTAATPRIPARGARRARRWVTLGVCAVLVGASGSPGQAQTTALSRLMRAKLETSQAVLAAVVTSSWGELERRSRALVQATADPAWTVLQTPEYARQSQSFERAAQDLVEAAQRRDLDAAPLAYVALTLRCVQCHRYVARARLAGPAR